MHALALALVAHPKGSGTASEIIHYLKEGGSFLIRHLGIVLALLILYVLWHRAGAVLWHLFVMLVVGVLVFPSVAPASIQASLGKVTRSGQHVGSTGLSAGLLVILVALAVVTIFTVMRSKHAPLARGVKKMTRQGAPEGEEG
jgi:hypothetical protein